MAWDGMERRASDQAMDDLRREMRALNNTMLEMHSENITASQARRDLLDAKLSQMAEAIHSLAMAVQSGDSKLAQDLAVHIAAPHHSGTVDRLNDHERRLDIHDRDIGKIKQRLQVEDNKLAVQTESRARRMGMLTLLAAAVAALGAYFGPILANIVNAWLQFFGASPPHRGP